MVSCVMEVVNYADVPGAVMNLTEMEAKVRFIPEILFAPRPDLTLLPGSRSYKWRSLGSIRLPDARDCSRHTQLVGHSTLPPGLQSDPPSQQLNEIMPMIYKRFTDKTAEEWRQIYKVRIRLHHEVPSG